MSRLPVYFERRPVGEIVVDGEGPGFSYDRDWLATRGAFPISTLMPLSKERYPSDVLVPWAANLLPESEHLRTVGRNLGVATSDVVGLLSKIGRDTAGALSIGHAGSTSAKAWHPIPTASALERIIDELPHKPFLAGDEGVSMSLAGAQSKLAVASDDSGALYVPTGGSPSTHILKPDARDLPGGVQNEAFCLTVARMAGLLVPRITTGVAGERTYLLVERYDRVLSDGRWRRTHQEDFCQALGKPPSAKYESNSTGTKGPTLAEMFAATRRHAQASDVLRLLDMLVVNVTCCNTDAHAKNYAMLVRADGCSLAPLYDVMCADVWGSITQNLAQKVAGKNRGGHLKGRHWQRMARECGLNPALVVARVGELAASIGSLAAAAASEVESMPAGGHRLLGEARKSVERRSREILSGLREVEVSPRPEREEEEPSGPAP